MPSDAAVISRIHVHKNSHVPARYNHALLPVAGIWKYVIWEKLLKQRYFIIIFFGRLSRFSLYTSWRAESTQAIYTMQLLNARIDEANQQQGRMPDKLYPAVPRV